MQANEDFFREIIEHVNEGVLFCDSQKKIIYANPKICSLLAYTNEELQNKTPYDFFDDETRSTSKYHFENFRSKGVSSQYSGNLIAKTGALIPILISGAPLSNGCTVGIYTDLSDVKKKEKQMHDDALFLATILENSGDAIISADLDFQVTSWNKGAEEMFGYSEAEILDKSVLDFMVPEDKHEEVKKMRFDVNERGIIRNFKTIRKRKDGILIHVSITMTAVKYMNGEINGYISIYRDISLQNKWEQELNIRFENLKEAYQALGKKSRYMDYFGELLDIIVGNGAISNFHEYIVAAVAYITKVDACILRVYSDQTKQLIRKGSYGVGDEWRGKDVIMYKGSLAESAFEKKHSIKVYNILNEPKYQSTKLAQKHGFFSLMVVPLYVKDKLYGSMSLYLKNDSKFDLLDNDFIETFAKLISVALSNK